MTQKQELIGLIDNILQDVEKQAEAKTEAGGYTGSTTHPSKNVDDGTQEATEGARSAENTSDNKAEPNRGQVVDKATEGPGAGQDSVQMDVGITSKATGEDPSAETDSTKGGKEDSDTSHPARTDNNELEGGKYASDIEKLEAWAKEATDLGSQLVAAIAAMADSDIKQASQTKEAQKACDKQAEPKKSEPKKAEQANYDLAGVFANIDVPGEDKQAADAMVVDTLSDILAVAVRRAEKAAEFYTAHFEAAKKAAEEAEDDGEEAESSDPPEAAGEEAVVPPAAPVEEVPPGPAEGEPAAMPGELPGEEAAPAPEGEPDLSALLAGGEGMGAEGAIGGMGADPAAGVDPAMGAEPGLGADPGMGGGEGADLAQLEQILAELGISPEELELAIAGKQASLLKKKQAEKKASDDRQKKYAAMKQMIQELVGRSRTAS